MRRLLFVLALAVVTATVGRGDDKITADELLLLGRLDTSRWFVCRLTNDSLTALDMKSIKKTATSQFVVWLRWDFSATRKTQDGKTYDHYLDREELDCSESGLRTKLMTRTYYLKNDDEKTQTANDPTWEDIPPDSIAETAISAACQFAKKTTKVPQRK